MKKKLSLCIMIGAVGSMLLADIAAAVPTSAIDSTSPTPPILMPLETPLPTGPLVNDTEMVVAQGTLEPGTRNFRRRDDRPRRFDERRYNRRVHGDRCLYRRDNCRYYRSGYYYRSPWWLLPLAIPGAVIGSTSRRAFGSNHVQWCSDRYRSYNPRTNLWLSYSGQYRQCVSPY